MKTITKALATSTAKKSVAAVAAGALAMTSAAPAFARGHDRVDAGEIIAGAVILGGIAAILSSGNNKRDRYRDDNRYDARYDNRRGNGEQAIQKCIRAAERNAQRSGFRYANVTQIRDVDRTRDGWRVEGRIVVDGARNFDRRGYNNRNYDRRDYNADSGRFTCDVSRGRVFDIDYRGIRGLR